MQRLLLSAIGGVGLALGFAVPAQAEPTFVTVDGGPGEAERQSTNLILASPTEGSAFQFIYDASAFGTQAKLMTGITLRYDQGYSHRGGPQLDNWATDATFAIRLGVVSGPGSLVPAQNRNATMKTVMSGARTITTSIGGLEGETKQFGVPFVFDTPFTYDPAEGNLLVDLVFPKMPNRFLTVDALKAGSYGRGIGPLSFSRSYYYNVPVARFSLDDLPVTSGILPGKTPPVPEPATWALMIAGFGMTGGMLRRRGRPGVVRALSRLAPATVGGGSKGGHAKARRV